MDERLPGGDPDCREQPPQAWLDLGAPATDCLIASASTQTSLQWLTRTPPVAVNRGGSYTNRSHKVVHKVVHNPIVARGAPAEGERAHCAR